MYNDITSKWGSQLAWVKKLIEKTKKRYRSFESGTETALFIVALIPVALVYNYFTRVRWFLALTLLAIGAWSYLGSPGRLIANVMWPNGAAPWEQVDVCYYPNANNPPHRYCTFDVGSVANCRTWVAEKRRRLVANHEEDSHECLVGPYLKDNLPGVWWRIIVR